MPVPVVITAYADRSFTFVTKTPPNSYFLHEGGGDREGLADARQGHVGKVTMEQVREIAQKKMTDLNAKDIDGACQHDHRLGPLDGPRGGGVATMAHKGKRLSDGYEGIDRDAFYERGGRGEAHQGARQGQVRRDHRGLAQPQHRSAQGRPERARHGDAAERHRQDACASPSSPRATRPRRPRPPAPTSSAPRISPRRSGRADRVRPLHRHARHDVGRRQARQNAGAARPDAQPAARHGDAERRRGGARRPRAARSSTAPRRPASSMPASARRASPRRRWSRTCAPSSARSAAAKPTGVKGTYIKKVSLSSTMGPGLKLEVSSLAAGGGGLVRRRRHAAFARRRRSCPRLQVPVSVPA